MPKSDDNLASWIEKLSKANHISFEILFKYIEKISKEVGFLQALIKISGISIEELSKFNNQFRDKFWYNSNLCPIKECNYKNKYMTYIFKHLRTHHNIGVKWYKCSHCDFKTKRKDVLEGHLVRIHKIGVEWKKCPYCDYKATDKNYLKDHLAFTHNIVKKII